MDTAGVRKNDVTASPAREAVKEESPGETGAAIAGLGEDSDDGRVNLAYVGSRSPGTGLEFDRRRDGCSNPGTPVTGSGGCAARKRPGKPVFIGGKATGRETTARASVCA